MRFSPVLLAALTASAVVGLAHSADAQTSDTPDAIDPNEAIYQPPAPQSLESDRPIQSDAGALTSTTANSPRSDFSAAAIDRSAPVEDLHLGVSPTSLSQPERSPVEFLAQTIQEPPAEPELLPETPPAGSQTPEEETPNQLPITPAPPNAPIFQEGDLQPDSNIAPTEEAVPGEDTVPGEDSTPGDESAPAPEQAPDAPPTDESQSEQEARVLVAEVLVTGAEGELQELVYRNIRTRPGQTTTRSQLQEDINSVFTTGFFSNVRAIPEDTPLGVRVTFAVTPNPVLESVQLQGSQVETLVYEGEELPTEQAINEIFQPQYGSILNLQDLQGGVEQLNQLYQDNGYVLAQVVGAPQISPEGVVTLEVAEGVIEDIQIRFLDRDGNAVDEEGEPIDGRTRDFIITREFESQPGEVFNQNRIQSDLQRAFGLGIFEDLSISLNPGQDPRQVDVVVNVTEASTGSFSAGVGVSSASGIFGTASFQEQNLGGNNQRLNAEVQIGERDLLFDVSFTDPWIGGDPNRTSYTVNAFGRQSLSLVFAGADDDIELPNGDRPRVRRFGGGVSFSRPFGDGWRGSVGLQYQRVSIRDLDGEVTPRSEFGTLLSFNESGEDDITSLQFSVSNDRRNDPLQATSGSFFRASTEQAIPIGSNGVGFNRLRASYSYFLPVRITDFTPGCRQEAPSPGECPQTIAFNVQAGTILGDLPPYEAFSLGGTDSVRGYDAGELASGRSFLQATVEYRFPMFSIISGALFADFGTDLGTADEVPGDPAVILDKPGTGFGYGVGLRVQSPLGQIRIDYALNDDGEDQIHFGIGERF